MKANKEVIRIILVLLFSLIFTLEITERYDLLSGLIILILLIFDLFERNHTFSPKSELIYYISWIVIGLLTFIIRKSHIGPFFPIFNIFIIKLLTFIIFLTKYKSFPVTRTILSKIALITIALYILELILNSTHKFSSIPVFCTIISSIELLIILLIEKKRTNYKPSILTYILKK